MCPQPPKAENEPQTEFNRQLIRLMAPGPVSLALTGGEPTVVGEDLLVLIEECRDRLPNTNLILLTNGRNFKHRDYVDRMARLEHPSLTVAVALYGDVDTLHNEIVRSRGAFADTVRGLHNLALYRFTIEIRVVILSLNFQRLARLAEFIYANLPFAGHVAFMGLETVGLVEENLELVWVDPFDYRAELEEACRYLCRRMIPVSIYNVPLCLLRRSIWSLARKSISDWKNVYLPACNQCHVRDECGGFFLSSEVKRSAHILPVGD
jgi:His-Xaa-Ser system radical SAM maturase HxsC